MNRVVTSDPTGRDVDDVLTAFFKSEMPSPWPAPPDAPRRRTLTRRAAPPRRRLVFGSRLSLVASVAALLFTAWLLGGGSYRAFRGPDLPIRHGPPDASLKNIKPPEPAAPVPPEARPDQPPLPPLPPANKKPAGKVKSSLTLRQGTDGHTSVGVTVVEPSLPGK
jgi:hypothetical protein